MSMKKRTGPFIVIYGEEDFFLDEMVLAHRKAKRESLYLNGESVTEDEFIGICDEESLTGNDRTVILDNAQKLKGKLIKSFIERRSVEDLSTLIVVVIRDSKLSDVWQQAGLKGSCRSYPKFKPWEEDKVRTRIRDEAEKIGLAMEEDVPALFHRLLGDNLRTTVNELRKLKVIDTGKRISKQDVLRIIAPDMSAEPFEVAEAATDKNIKGAMRLIGVLWKNSGDTVAVPITASLLKQVERLVLTRQCLDRGDPIEVIAASTGVHKFVAQKSFVPRAQKYTLSSLKTHMQTLCRLDSLVKSSSQSKRLRVELAVLSLAA